MLNGNALVSDCMRLSSISIHENDTLFDALEIMKKFDLKTISVIKDDFSIVGHFTREKIKEILEKDFNNNIYLLKSIKIKNLKIKHDFPILLYPNMTVIDAISTMKYFNMKCIPVVNLPWEKRMIGFLWLDDILSVIKKNYLKVSV